MIGSIERLEFWSELKLFLNKMRCEKKCMRIIYEELFLVLNIIMYSTEND